MVSGQTVSRSSFRLLPSLTLAELFGPGVAYVPRRSPNLPGWGSTVAGAVDSQTGNQLATAGGMPVVASAGVVTPRALELLADAGLPIEADLHDYRSPAEYFDLIRRLPGRGLRLATQRVHPEQEIPAAASLVPPDLQRELNDKGRMADVVPAEWLAPRRVIDVARLPPADELLSGGEPVVLKAATPLPSGGGYCVWICRAPAEVEAARAALRGERGVVIEKYLSIRRTVCVHAAVLPDGPARLTGVAEEVCGPGGRWHGNWLDAEADAIPAGVLDVVMQIVAPRLSADTAGSPAWTWPFSKTVRRAFSI